MIRLVACDLDGTIIDTHNQCDPRIGAYVQELQKQGIRFAVCSGRPVYSYLHMLENWHLSMADYLIGSNGGEVLERESGRFQESYTLSEELIREIISVYSPLGLIPTIYSGRDLYVDEMIPRVSVLAERIGIRPIQADIRRMLSGPMIKEMFIGEPEQVEAAERYAAEHPDARYAAFKTAVDLFEVNHPLLGKDAGLRAITEMSGIMPEEMAAFGDTTNDIAMFRYVHYGICMENGSEDARQAAYAIAPSVSECGFVTYMQAHLSEM